MKHTHDNIPGRRSIYVTKSNSSTWPDSIQEVPEAIKPVVKFLSRPVIVYEPVNEAPPVYQRPIVSDTVGPCPRKWYSYAKENIGEMFKNMENVMFIRTV